MEQSPLLNKWDMTLFACVFHVLRALATPTHMLALYLYNFSSHPCGMAIAPDLMQMGACNQGKKDFQSKIHAVGATPPLGYYWREFSECTLTRFSRNRQKKKPPQQAFQYLSMSNTQKDFCQLSVTSENYIPQ